MERQSHCQFQTPESSAPGDIADDAEGDTGAAVVDDVAALAAGAWALDSVPAAAAAAPAPIATFAWVTFPLSPGLAIRMLTLTFVGATCVATAPGGVAGG